MNNYKNLEGQIKTIKTMTKNGSKTILREENGIIISCKPLTHLNSQYRIEGLSLLGKYFIINIDDNSEISDLEIHEKKVNCLVEIRNSILRKRKALEIIDEEKNNIENLKVVLLSDTDNMTQNDFINNLRETLTSLDLGLKVSEEHRFGNVSMNIQLNECNIHLYIKKNHISDIKIKPITYSSKEKIRLDKTELKEGKNYKKFDSYYIEDFFSKQYYDLIDKNELEIKENSRFIVHFNNIETYSILHYLNKENDKLFLDKATLDFIIQLVRVIEKCKIPY